MTPRVVTLSHAPHGPFSPLRGLRGCFLRALKLLQHELRPGLEPSHFAPKIVNRRESRVGQVGLAPLHLGRVEFERCTMPRCTWPTGVESSLMKPRQVSEKAVSRFTSS